MNEEQPQTPRPEERDYADRDVQVKFLANFLVGTAVFTAFTLAIGVIYFKVVRRQLEKENAPWSQVAQSERTLPANPRLEISEPATLAQHLVYESNLLNHYAWVDQGNGVVRIPIERAMKLVLERGFPVAESAK